MKDPRLERALRELRVRFHLRLAESQGLAADEAWIRSKLGEMSDSSLARKIGARFGHKSGLRALLRRIGLWR